MSAAPHVQYGGLRSVHTGVVLQAEGVSERRGHLLQLLGLLLVDLVLVVLLQGTGVGRVREARGVEPLTGGPPPLPLRAATPRRHHAPGGR